MALEKQSCSIRASPGRRLEDPQVIQGPVVTTAGNQPRDDLRSTMQGHRPGPCVASRHWACRPGADALDSFPEHDKRGPDFGKFVTREGDRNGTSTGSYGNPHMWRSAGLAGNRHRPKALALAGGAGHAIGASALGRGGAS